jgi:hypothetical protein
MKIPYPFAVVICSLIVLCVGALAVRAQSTPSPTGPVGRYTLTESHFTVSGAGVGGVDLQGLFKIDTVTGQTWTFVASTKNGTITEFWSPIAQK